MIHFAIRRKLFVLVVASAVCFLVAMFVAFFNLLPDEKEQQQGDGQIEVSEMQISSKYKGRVLDLCVKVGDYVNIGDTLAVIGVLGAEKNEGDNRKPVSDDDRIRNSYLILQKAKAGFDIAEKTYLNMKRLFDEGNVTENAFNDALTNYKLMEGQVMAVQNFLKQLQADNGERAIVSRVRGEISDLYIQKGDLVYDGTPLLNVSMMDDLWGTFLFDEAYLKNWKLGDVLKVHVLAFNKEVKMQIYDISDIGEDAIVGNVDRTKWRYSHDLVEVKARPIDYVEGLRPGMLLKVME